MNKQPDLNIQMTYNFQQWRTPKCWANGNNSSNKLIRPLFKQFRTLQFLLFSVRLWGFFPFSFILSLSLSLLSFHSYLFDFHFHSQSFRMPTASNYRVMIMNRISFFSFSFSFLETEREAKRGQERERERELNIVNMADGYLSCQWLLLCNWTFTAGEPSVKLKSSIGSISFRRFDNFFHFLSFPLSFSFFSYIFLSVISFSWLALFCLTFRPAWGRSGRPRSVKSIPIDSAVFPSRLAGWLGALSTRAGLIEEGMLDRDASERREAGLRGIPGRWRPWGRSGGSDEGMKRYWQFSWGVGVGVGVRVRGGNCCAMQQITRNRSRSSAATCVQIPGISERTRSRHNQSATRKFECRVFDANKSRLRWGRRRLPWQPFQCWFINNVPRNNSLQFHRRCLSTVKSSSIANFNRIAINLETIQTIHPHQICICFSGNTHTRKTKNEAIRFQVAVIWFDNEESWSTPMPADEDASTMQMRLCKWPGRSVRGRGLKGNQPTRFNYNYFPLLSFLSLSFSFPNFI